MNLNEWVFRDDAVEPLGAEPEIADNLMLTEDNTADPLAPSKIGIAAIGSAALGLSHFLGQVAKSL